MQTILGASGQIARELARELTHSFSADLRLVSRNPHKVNDTDTLMSADLLDGSQTLNAVKGSRIVYFAAGLPPDSSLWEKQFPVMLQNALNATRQVGAHFVYFDNTYMYPQDSRRQTEDMPFQPSGRKGRVRAMMANMVLEEMLRGEIPVLIGRAPEFYGPGKTQSFTNALVLDRLKAGKKPLVPLRDDTLRTLIWTPDASRALALLGNTPDAYGQTWHLPCCEEPITYAQFVSQACSVFGKETSWSVLNKIPIYIAGIFSKGPRELRELLPRYEADNLFDSSKFKSRFPDFRITTYRQGLENLYTEWKATSALNKDD
ncbi:NAD-dependent dehydratase [Enterobacter hormaechei subsp. steigerwaltii]|uniref:NAD-dependent epimerase/dehydratase family protein n=1 Tax=Enterobacter TaxID=547 RepID=UPI0005EF43C9|nr:NAD-dependent epimerase/dehydratase family protein [Enterobacter hormaechei]KJL72760.1 NAD-dependent dehydratase [Enterobacter hormaechei subsp. steigerwaltii]KJL80664.1 NAD-dependent dehydratase [Enterobacter hormaechei subsp. steigerwaltii]KJW80002.1 NAD-dependent dehydratase [Enterobacter hormaechei subsp. steigerwaltii]KJW80077.1 NAD-dependent dehydratase [Enterobacter hormaechei subsp. steigerwaltii]KJW99182.1 NAD-dependent dehydratase [Enterobacter hormaechei subsp. steigerwaltii]